MSNLKKIAKEIGITLLDSFRKASYRQIDDAVLEEETRGIKKNNNGYERGRNR